MRAYLTAALLTVLAYCPMASASPADAPSNLKVLSRLTLGGEGGWDYLSFDAQRRHLFVSRGERVLVIDVDHDKQIATIDNTHGVHGIAIAQDLHRGFTSNGKASSVTVFDLDTLKTVATITGTGLNPDSIVYDAVSHHVFTFNGKSGNASVIDPSRNQVVATIALPGRPEFGAATPDGRLYVNIEDKSEVVQIDPASNTVTHVWTLAPCESPSGLTVDSTHHRLFSVCDNGVMAVTDSNDGHHVATVKIGDGPDAVSFDAATSMIYSSNGESGSITAMHEDTPDHYTVVATVPTQVSARTQALDPQEHRIYLSAAQPGTEKGPHGRLLPLPGSFSILTVGQP